VRRPPGSTPAARRSKYRLQTLRKPEGGGMPDPVTTLAAVALAAATLSVILARFIPDEYDRLTPEPVRVERRSRR
jgi:hypothetical protein